MGLEMAIFLTILATLSGLNVYATANSYELEKKSLLNFLVVDLIDVDCLSEGIMLFVIMFIIWGVLILVGLSLLIYTYGLIGLPIFVIGYIHYKRKSTK